MAKIWKSDTRYFWLMLFQIKRPRQVVHFWIIVLGLFIVLLIIYLCKYDDLGTAPWRNAGQKTHEAVSTGKTNCSSAHAGGYLYMLNNQPLIWVYVVVFTFNVNRWFFLFFIYIADQTRKTNCQREQVSLLVFKLLHINCVTEEIDYNFL